MNQIVNSQAARDIASQVHPQTNLRLHATRGPMIIERAQGPYVVDDGGQRYLDAMAGLWCVSLGYSDPAVRQAIKDQVDALPYFQLFAHRSNNPSIDLAAKLLEVAPVAMSKVLFQCSGSEANDTALKLAWYYWNAQGRPAKRKVISRQRSYHGTGIASASMTGLPHLHMEFNLPLEGVRYARCPHHYREGLPGESEEAFSRRLAAELEELILAEGADSIAAMIVEPAMGTGGAVIPPKGYFEAIQPVLRRHEILVIADEVITGFGRTGSYWGSQTFGLQPDLVTCAKALSSAYLPVSAVLISEPIYAAMVAQSDKVGVFAHGYTYGGHPVCAAAALATLKRYEELRIVEQVQDVGPYLQRRLRELADHPLVGEVRGVGLMAAVELVRDKATRQPFERALQVGGVCSGFAQARGLLSRNLGDSLAFSPPLILTRAQVDEILDAFAPALDETLAWARREGHL